MARCFSAKKSKAGKAIKCGRCDAKIVPGNLYYDPEEDTDDTEPMQEAREKAEDAISEFSLESTKETGVTGSAQQPGRWYKDGSGFRSAEEFEKNLAAAQRTFEPWKVDWRWLSKEVDRALRSER